jgi:hypothetical protein
MNYSYIIIDDDQESVLKTKPWLIVFRAYFVASANNYEEGLNLILERPQLIFLEIDPSDKKKELSLIYQ